MYKSEGCANAFINPLNYNIRSICPSRIIINSSYRYISAISPKLAMDKASLILVKHTAGVNPLLFNTPYF